MGIEPTSSAWEAEALPLSYTRDGALRNLLQSAATQQSRLDSIYGHCCWKAPSKPYRTVRLTESH